MTRLFALLLLGFPLALPLNTRAQAETPCPASVASVATCRTGTDQNGATWWLAMPKEWNRTLVLHAHGGPRLKAIDRDTSVEDLNRFAVTIRQGYAWAASSYRRPGYSASMAAEDTENLRKIVLGLIPKPDFVILHGQSFGGNVAAKAAELYPASWNGVVLTNGLVAGGTRNYLHRVDLRALWQVYCANHPRADEAQYPLWQGLPPGAKMTNKELDARIDECTGLFQPRDKRSAQQQKNLDELLKLIRVPESNFAGHMHWATFLFRDMVSNLLGGHNPFSNQGVVYRGSSDDEALNKAVPRFAADPEGARRLAEDSDMTGEVKVPVISLHAIDDPVAMVEYEDAYRATLAARGREGQLVQVFSRENQHSKLSDAEYAALFDGMLGWLRDSVKPSPQSVAARCAMRAQEFSGGCHIDAAYKPAPLFSRMAPR